MKKLFFIAALLITATHANAQAPTIEWQNTIGGSNADRLHSIQQTTDGGYVLGGYSDSNTGGDKTENRQGGNDY